MRPGGRQDIAFDLAPEQIEMVLARDRPDEVLAARRPLALDDLPRREVAVSDVADLAGSHEVIERPQRLVDWRRGVREVDLVEIDHVGFEAAQAALDGLAQPAPRGPPLVLRIAHGA